MAALYQAQPYLRVSRSMVVAAFEADNGQSCVALRDSIFYPQGGGQKGDRGRLTAGDKSYSVIDTVKDAFSSDGRPLCVLETSGPTLSEGEDVLMELDWERRYSQMRLHSVVHLHHCAMELVIGRPLVAPVTSDLNTDQTAYNRYENADITEEVVSDACEKMRRLIEQGAPIQASDDPAQAGYRRWECLGFTIPCGGTHLKDIAEVGKFSATFSKKKGRPKVSFRLFDAESHRSEIDLAWDVSCVEVKEVVHDNR